MPPQSRAQRRRQAARQQQQSRRPAPPRNPEAEGGLPDAEAGDAVATGPTIALGAPAVGEARRVESRPAARTTRRVLSRPAPEPIDYSKEYADVRRDLRWIALWSVLLFAGMIALKFSGLV